MKILIIELSNIGDAILTLPALQRLWKAYPDSEFHLLASPRTRELFSGDPRIHRVWLWDKKVSVLSQGLLIARLARQRFGLVVDFRHSLIPLFLGGRRAPLIRKVPPNGMHRAEQHRWVVEALEIPPVDGPSPIWFGPEEERAVESWIKPSTRRVVMAPGSRSHLKRWPAARFAQVADRLVREMDSQIFLVGDEEDRPVVKAVLDAMGQTAVDLSGRTTIHQLAALLRRTELVITNDSACLHAAEAMQIPSVAIFGPTDEKKYGPRLPRSAVVRRHLVCAPCERALCPYGHECMQGLEANEVYEAAVRILKGASG